MANKVWIVTKDDWPGSGDPIIGIFWTIRNAVKAISKILGGDPKVEKHGTEMVLTNGKDKYFIKSYSVRN